jgi:hypothetical protein
MSEFLPIPLVDGGEVSCEALTVRTWGGAAAKLAGGTVFACATEATRLSDGVDTFTLRPGMWCVMPDGCAVEGGRGLAIIVPGYRGLRVLGGPLEAHGRLRYIDGCTDTLLAGPPRLGEPCLNHLHIPPRTLQSRHTHPSLRAGLIARGHGACVTPSTRTPLSPGLGWLIPAGLPHAFHTEGASLDVLAFHPDSDTGPTDEDHPMLNRTFR